MTKNNLAKTASGGSVTANIPGFTTKTDTRCLQVHRLFFVFFHQIDFYVDAF